MLKFIFAFLVIAITLTKTYGQLMPDTSACVKTDEKKRNQYYVTMGGGIVSTISAKDFFFSSATEVISFLNAGITPNFLGGHFGLGISLSKNVFEIKYISRSELFGFQHAELFTFSYGRNFISKKTEITPMCGLSIESGLRKGDINDSGGLFGWPSYEKIEYTGKIGFIIQLEAAVNIYKFLSCGANIFYNKNSEFGSCGILGIVRVGKLR